MVLVTDKWVARPDGMLGFTKKVMVELFGSTGDTGKCSPVGILLHLLKWGGVASTFLFMMGFMLYEFGVTVGIVEYRRVTSQPEALAEMVDVDEVIDKYGDQIRKALNDGTIDEMLGHKRVPADLKRRIKEEMKQRLNEPRSASR